MVYTVRAIRQTGRLQNIVLRVEAEQKRAKTLAGGGAERIAQNAGGVAGLPFSLFLFYCLFRYLKQYFPL
jgi:hypothetical protein